jgi:hypothetical protein
MTMVSFCLCCAAHNIRRQGFFKPGVEGECFAFGAKVLQHDLVVVVV